MSAITDSLFANSKCEEISRDELAEVWRDNELAVRASIGRYASLNDMEDKFLYDEQQDIPEEFKEAYALITRKLNVLRSNANSDDLRVNQYSRSLLNVLMDDVWRPMLRATIPLNFLSDLHRDHHYRSSRWQTTEAMALLASAISLRTRILVTPEQLLSEEVPGIEIDRINDPVLDHGPPRNMDIFIRTKNQADADEIRARW